MLKLFIPLLFVGQVALCAQDAIRNSIPKLMMEKANTAANANYLSQAEKDVILYMNLARIDGQWFLEHIYNKQSNFMMRFSASYRNSLVKELKSLKDVPVLNPAKGLTKSARYHAKDMGRTGATGHQSTDGTPTFKRIKKYAKGGYMAENCQYGWSDAVEIVLDLLIDDGISSLGHRKNILNSKYIFVGVAIEPHKVYRVNCVQDFSDTGD